MEKIKSIKEINTNSKEGRLLVAAIAKLSVESQTDKTPDEILEQCHSLAETMYEDNSFPGPINLEYYD